MHAIAAKPPWQRLDANLRRGVRPVGDPRQGKRWTNVELADCTGLSPRTIGNIRRGHTHRPRDLEVILRTVFGPDDDLTHQTERQLILDGYDSISADQRCWSIEKEILTAPDRCYGRESETVDLIGMIASSAAVNIAVLGAPGIGKTTLTQQVAVSPPAITRFKHRRWFVELEAAQNASDLRNAIIEAIGFNHKIKTFRSVLHYLRRGPTLLVLSNLEMPWERDKAAVQACLKELATIPTVSLLVSIRGTEIPTSPAFSKQVLEPLSPSAAEHLFLSLAPSIAQNDPYLAKFLLELGGLPLAIELVAYRAALQSDLQELWQEWEKRGVQLASNSSLQDGRLSSLARSVDLSLHSPRLRREGKRLFSLLGQLPGGLASDDHIALLKADAFQAQEQLQATGLAFFRNGRIKMLSPIRTYARDMLAPCHEDMESISQYYLHVITDMGKYIVMRHDEKIRPDLELDIVNLEAVILHGFKLPSENGNLIRFSNLSFDPLVVFAYTNYLKEETLEHPKLFIGLHSNVSSLEQTKLTFQLLTSSYKGVILWQAPSM